jgi:enamine deaminase RidA (YjgF/YER057c/UK114 family)
MKLERNYLHPGGVTGESGRWSHASSVVIGNARLIFVAGQTARREDGQPLSDDDFEKQFRRVYDSLGLVLSEAGATFDAVTSMRAFLTRREDIEAYTRLRDAAHDVLFPAGKYPPSTLVVVDGLAHPQMLLEVEAIAVVSA